MRVNDSYRDINVARQLEESDSVLRFWKDMIKFRKEHADLLVYGSFDALDLENETTFVFVKKHAGSEALVALNFSSESAEIDLPQGADYVLQVSNYTGGAGTGDRAALQGSKTILRPWEAHLYLLQKPSA